MDSSSNSEWLLRNHHFGASTPMGRVNRPGIPGAIQECSLGPEWPRGSARLAGLCPRLVAVLPKRDAGSGEAVLVDAPPHAQVVLAARAQPPGPAQGATAPGPAWAATVAGELLSWRLAGGQPAWSASSLDQPVLALVGSADAQ